MKRRKHTLIIKHCTIGSIKHKKTLIRAIAAEGAALEAGEARDPSAELRHQDDKLVIQFRTEVNATSAASTVT